MFIFIQHKLHNTDIKTQLHHNWLIIFHYSNQLTTCLICNYKIDSHYLTFQTLKKNAFLQSHWSLHKTTLKQQMSNHLSVSHLLNYDKKNMLLCCSLLTFLTFYEHLKLIIIHYYDFISLFLFEWHSKTGFKTKLILVLKN